MQGYSKYIAKETMNSIGMKPRSIFVSATRECAAFGVRLGEEGRTVIVALLCWNGDPVIVVLATP